MATADLSRLEMCREILLANGIELANVLDTGGASDMAKAEEFLEQAGRDAQMEHQWAFHENLEYEIEPDGNDEILVPAGTVLIRAEGALTDKVYAQRGNKIVNITDGETTFETSQKLRVYLRYEVDCIPPHVRLWCMRRAALLLCEFRGGGPRYNLLYMAERKAWANALRVDNDIRRTNTLNTDHAKMAVGERPVRYFG